MAEIVIMPKLGLNMSEGKLGQRYMAEGAASASARAPAPAAADEAAPAASGSSYDYDIAVIGGGPGGYVAAIKAAQMGKKVVIAEKESFGGTCLNVGCIPTKTLLRSAEALKEVKESEVFGVVDVDVSAAALDMKKVQARKNDVVGHLVGGVRGLLDKNGVEIRNGEARIVDHHTIKVDGKDFTADNIIIATGSVSKGLPITISEEMNVMTSTEALDLEEVPASIAIIGGGVIGIEFAYLLSELGAEVTVIEFLDRILPMVDEEITKQVTANFKKKGVKIFTSAKVTEITADGVKFEKKGAEEEVKVETVLMSVGRAPRLDGIDTEALGIKTEKGAIVTDDTLKTSIPNIYAIGDVNGKIMLAHTASAEGIVAVQNICGEKASMDYSKIPSAIYIQPEIASIGLTEAQAVEKYGKVNVGKFPMMANGKAKIQGEARGLVKVIAEPKYGEIVGVHMYCVHATDMIAEAAVAMSMEGTAEELSATVHPHPTVSEVVMEAMHAVEGKAIHC